MEFKRIKDTLYNVIDSNTGEVFNYDKVTLWYDGSAMDDTKADGVIYRKLGSEYFKRAFGGAVSVRWFGLFDTTLETFNTFKKALVFCRANKTDLYCPSAVYDCGVSNFPFSDYEDPAVLDYQNITVFGDGQSTVFKTTSVLGADVLQLNRIKNLSFRNISITGIVTSTYEAGTNGISVTGGYDNLNFYDVFIYGLRGIDKGDYIDGGKALTIQPALTENQCGTLNARIHVVDCAYGFGVDCVISNLLEKKTSINVDIVAENCYRGVSFDAAEATENVDLNASIGLNIIAKTINCQIDAVMSRGIGVNLTLDVQTTKSKEDRTLAPDSSPWFASNQIVYAVLSNYIKKGNVVITGNKGDCDYKFQIGAVGSIVEPFNLINRTEDSQFTFNLSGDASVSNFNVIEYGGNSIANCVFNISRNTLDSVDPVVLLAENYNTVTIGSVNNSGRLYFKNFTIDYGDEVPEGLISADTGSLYIRTSGGAALWAKRFGSGDTGWDNVLFSAEAVADSSAVTVETLKNDFNGLLAILRAASIIKT